MYTSQTAQVMLDIQIAESIYAPPTQDGLQAETLLITFSIAFSTLLFIDFKIAFISFLEQIPYLE